MIVFKTLRYQNILSTGNQFTEIYLNKSKSTLVVGENGAGKSTFIDALTFALYGRPYRDINKPQLLNTITGKNLLVELEFSIGAKEYMIRRGIKPNIFEIYVNGKLQDQDSKAGADQDHLERKILKLNFKSFRQIVVLGAANYVPFMKLKSGQRRDVVEDLLDIQIFSVMNSILKEKVSANKAELQQIDSDIRLCEQKLHLHSKHIDSLKANNDDIINQKNIKVAEYRGAIQELQRNSGQLLSQVAELSEQVADEQKAADRRTKLLQFEGQLEDRIRRLKKEMQFFHDHDNCPTCKQGLSHEFKEEKIEARRGKTAEIEDALAKLEAEMLKNNERLENIRHINADIHQLNEQIRHHQQQISFYNKYIVEINSEIATLQEQSHKIVNDTDMTKQLQKELKAYNGRREGLSNQKALLDVSSVLLKDTGIKTKIIRQYVPIMNKLINKYLAAMDFFVNFELNESFEESIKSRFRDEFSYDSFSEGEKMRIDLALMFTWRAIAKLRNSASTNILIMDEVFDSSLDASGTEEFLKILESLTTDTNTFIISHKGDQLFDRFHSVIRFEKHANFSRIAV